MQLIDIAYADELLVRTNGIKSLEDALF